MNEYLINIGLLVLFAVGSYLVEKYIKKLLIAQINNLVQLAEAQIQGSGLGAAKKAWVIAQLESVGVKATDGVSEIIDDLVTIMNLKKSSLLDAVK